MLPYLSLSIWVPIAFGVAVLDVYGVRYAAITNAPSEGHFAKRRALAPPRWREVASAAETTVYENLRALPLAWPLYQ